MLRTPIRLFPNTCALQSSLFALRALSASTSPPSFPPLPSSTSSFARWFQFGEAGDEDRSFVQGFCAYSQKADDSPSLEHPRLPQPSPHSHPSSHSIFRVDFHVHLHTPLEVSSSTGSPPHATRTSQHRRGRLNQQPLARRAEEG
ncbi:hypothetical protein BKA70DRAFT_1426981 [Coprinopsis sp. MPI-PUGE-AT-0042]|nr:hypothetical protein BKA70DRAFT_1426981 [Coprinopsis sp. MPI-PUGE-AT-0042]